jgi:hypothetical protein
MQITADRYRLDQAMKRAMGECVRQAKWEQPQCPTVFNVPANGSRAVGHNRDYHEATLQNRLDKRVSRQ